ncbi:MAG: 2-C-methyl-D-erythritol 4-phosphate cytidylyltransferase [Selenomonadaceae bacterium]|nr:2-C-methyl-D-erythritol 4-phosphate cytidylyltransferase [Selenomonadaceae bacterium]
MISVIIPAAGQGKRFGAGKNKAFVLLAGKTILERTAAAFSDIPEVGETVIVVAPDEVEDIREQTKAYPKADTIKVVAGGTERQYSIENALKAVDEKSEIILVHDGARPMVSREVILRVIEAVRENSAVIAAVPVKDTIKSANAEGFVSATPKRSELWAVQTPQGFTKELIMRAYRKAREDDFLGTDDASLVERLGIPVKIILGEYENIKITTPEDLPIANVFLAAGKGKEQL